MPTQSLNGQTIEKLEVFTCQQAITYAGVCGENADYRIAIPGLSVTFCSSHAQPYLKSTKVLKVIKCTNCAGVCKPGYIYEADGRYYFCTQECRDFYRAPEDRNALAYR